MVPFSTWTRTVLGSTSTGRGSDGVDLPSRPACSPGLSGFFAPTVPEAVNGRSRRSAANIRSASSWSQSTVEPTPGTAWSGSATGTEANSEEAVVKPRMARARASSSSAPKFGSARTEPSSAETTRLSLAGFTSTPLWAVSSMTEARKRC